MDVEENNICKICNHPIKDLTHNSSTVHRYGFAKWQLKHYKKPLSKNRHGIELTINQELNNVFTRPLEYHGKIGKYSSKVEPDQLRRTQNTITFNCEIKNISKKNIYITNLTLLHPSDFFKLVTKHRFEPGRYSCLIAGRSFRFKISFKCRVLNNASYKIPLSCDFQIGDNTKNVENRINWTIVRFLVVFIDDGTMQKQLQTKSPFTSKSWTGVQHTVPQTNTKLSKDVYEVPSDYRRVLLHGLEFYNNITRKEEEYLEKLRGTLEYGLKLENYANFWHTLLWLEETAQSLMLLKYNMSEVKVQLKGDKLVFEVPGLGEKRPSVIVGDNIRLKASMDEQPIAYRGEVTRVTNDTVEISNLDPSFLERIRNNPDLCIDVSFQLQRLSFERMHAAVERIVESGLVAQLFPSLERNTLITKQEPKGLADTEFFNERIIHNPEQRAAVTNIINGKRTIPYIIFGPPGTGKSVTIIEAILQLKQRKRNTILVCASSNSACDMLASKLIPRCSTKELIRIHSKVRNIENIPNDLLNYSNIHRGEETEIVSVNEHQLKSYRIVVTTLILIGRFAGRYIPDWVFVDEAAQALEPECIIPISLLKTGRRIVLAGDPKQLGSMVNECSKKWGLEISLLERLMRCDIYSPNPATGSYDSTYITMLRLNYRSHPDIISIPNERFYDSKLEAVSLSPQRDPIASILIGSLIEKKLSSTNIVNHDKNPKNCAIEFFAVSGKEKKEGSSPSYFNLFEANAVVQFIQTMVNLNLHPIYKVRPDQIGVITPYKRQVFRIYDRLKKIGLETVEVGTTESFQGREKRIILISTVRAQHALLRYDQKYKLGFVRNPQRFNVALTRAISKQIIIGNPLVLRTDDKWNEYMTTCYERQSYFGNYFPPDDNNFKESVIERFRDVKEIDTQFQRSTRSAS